MPEKPQASVDLVAPTADAPAGRAAPDDGRPVSLSQMFRYADALDAALLLLGSLASLALGALTPISLVPFGDSIDAFGRVDLAGDQGSIVEAIQPIISLFLYVGIAAFGTGFLGSACFKATGERQADKWRVAYLEGIVRQDIAWHDARSTASLAGEFADATQLIEAGIGTKVSEGLRYLGQGVLGVGVAFWFQWDVALIMCGFAPFIGGAAVLLVRVNTRTTLALQAAFAAAGAVAAQALAAIRTVAAFGAEARETARFQALLEPAERVEVAAAWKKGFWFANLEFPGNLATAVALAYGGWRVASERLADPGNDCALTNSCAVSVGRTLLAIFGITLGAQGIGLIGQAVNAFSKARAAAGRALEVIERRPAIDAVAPAAGSAGDAPADVSAAKGAVVFDGVHFAYPARPEAPVYTDFNLAIEAGQTVALVGASGSGKSTAVQLLERFYDPDGGAVRLDGTDIRTLDLRWLRAQMGLVSQEPVLFDGTVADNIAYGKPGASRAEVEAAARSANAHGFISAMPQGYDTRVGQGGGQLSGGQKQRVAIARALIKKPAILILDEATSALDSESERVVQAALDQLMAERARTTIVIAHRLSTVRGADKIAVVGGGKVLEEGTHAQLLRRGEYYAALVSASKGGST